MAIEIQAKKPVIQMGTQGPSGGSSIPKPLTYDYMPEGYPTKSVQTTTLMEEQELAFKLNKGLYLAQITNAFEIVEGQTYTVNWDGTEYECVGSVLNSLPLIGNLSMMGMGDDTGEPFVYGYEARRAVGMFATLDTSASHTISVKTTEEVITPMAEEFLPNIPADKLPNGAITTLHINVTAVDMETKEATFTADKTPTEMLQASTNGSTWCVVTFAAGILAEEAIPIGVPPAWNAGIPAFGDAFMKNNDDNGQNIHTYAVLGDLQNSWILNLATFGV